MEQNFTELEKIEDVEKESRAFECPNCHTHLQFMVRVSVMGVRPTEVSAAQFVAQRAGDTPPKDRLASEERRVIEEARAAGVLDAFVAAAKVKSLPVPADLEAFVIQFLNTAVKVEAPQFVVKMFVLERFLDAEFRKPNKGHLPTGAKENTTA